jgi:hypothetical protein
LNAERRALAEKGKPLGKLLGEVALPCQPKATEKDACLRLKSRQTIVASEVDQCAILFGPRRRQKGMGAWLAGSSVV